MRSGKGYAKKRFERSSTSSACPNHRARTILFSDHRETLKPAEVSAHNINRRIVQQSDLARGTEHLIVQRERTAEARSANHMVELHMSLRKSTMKGCCDRAQQAQCNTDPRFLSHVECACRIAKAPTRRLLWVALPDCFCLCLLLLVRKVCAEIPGKFRDCFPLMLHTEGA